MSTNANTLKAGNGIFMLFMCFEQHCSVTEVHIQRNMLFLARFSHHLFVMMVSETLESVLYCASEGCFLVQQVKVVHDHLNKQRKRCYLEYKCAVYIDVFVLQVISVSSEELKEKCVCVCLPGDVFSSVRTQQGHF